MAVYAAHLTRTLQGTPSIFQIAAQEALGATVKPALKRLAEYLAAINPHRYAWCERWYDELYLLLDFCLQYHYLKHYAASFSECFYGLLRVPINPSNEFHSGVRLPELLEKGSLLLLVVGPYIKDKVDQFIEKWREDYEDGKFGKSTSDQARKAAIKVYSIAHFVLEAAKFIQLARYLTGGTLSPALDFALLGLTVKEAPPPEPEEHCWSDLFKSLWAGQISDVTLTFPLVGRGLLSMVQYGAYGVQLLKWWEARASPVTSLPLPTTPQKCDKTVKWKNKCPVCLQPWKVPTVLPVSGFVFCYGCVSRAVRAAGVCPASGLPASDRTLVRLYINT
ncbi:PREDICTED: peroxisome assembly protein 12 [Papilio polytes]|uniref:peroxisome assembly protein 12 n=1 Tax=Papilio polytes TaxID=76194 RepID=UPI0006768E60|nr:PREDICTED: peroxisome assembly protein 12 [Papilio polytes]